MVRISKRETLIRQLVKDLKSLSPEELTKVLKNFLPPEQLVGITTNLKPIPPNLTNEEKNKT